MTTITIKNSPKKFSKTSFEDAKDLFAFLREELFPVEIHLVDDDGIPKAINTSIEEAAKDDEADTVDFKG